MLFCIRLPNIIQIGPHIAEIWRHFSFSRWRPRPLNTTSGFLFVDAAVFRRSKSISIPNFIDIISIRGWDITTYVFENKPSPYGNSTSGFDFGYVTAVGMLFCIRLQNFVQIRPPTVEIWHIDFSRWRPFSTTSGFIFVDVTVSEGKSLSANQISSRYLNWWLRYNYFRFEIQTSAMLEFYFRFRSRPFRRNRRVILRQAAEFRPNRNIRRWNMTSYRFLRWRPSAMLYLL